LQPAKPESEFYAVELRHLVVDDETIGAIADRRSEQRRAIAERANVEPFGLQQKAQGRADVVVVVDDIDHRSLRRIGV